MRPLTRLLTRLLTALVLAAGLVTLLTRLATPLLSELRDDVAVLAGEALGVPLTIGGVQARWHGFRPIIELRDVDIGEAPETVHATRVSLNLSLQTLFSRDALRDSSIVIDGMRLTVVREPTGQVHVEGVELPGDSDDDDGDTAADGVALPATLRLVNTHLVWIDRKAGRAPVELDNIDAALDQDAAGFRVRAFLDSAAGSAELSLDIDRPPLSTDWNGTTYLRVANLDVARLFAHYLPPHYGLEAMTLALEAWNNWRDAAPVQGNGRFEISDLRVRPQLPGTAFELESVSGGFDAVHENDALRIGLDDLNVVFADHTWPAGRVAAEISTSPDDRQRVSVSWDYLRIADLARLAGIRLPDPDWHQVLADMRPDGEIHGLRFELHGDGSTWQIAARLQDVKFRPSGDIPGVHNLDAMLLGNQDRLSLQLDSHNTTLVFDHLFRNPLELTRLGGRVDIDFGAQQWQARSDLLVADSAHIKTRSRVFLDQQANSELFIDVQTDFRDGDAAHASLYYPTGIMGRELVHWLDHSIESGRVRGGSALIYGPVGDFAFENSRSGMFQVLFDTEDVRLAYRPGWPPLTQVDAHVRFEGNHVDIHTRSAQIYDSQVERLHARIGSLEPIAPLEVEGRLRGPLRDNLRVLQEEALADRFGNFAAALAGSGRTTLDLDFRIPLKRRDDNYALKGRLAFGGNELSLPEWDLTMRDVSGDLHFTLDGLRAEGIRAQALGAPVTVDVMPGSEGTTRVRTRGRLAVDDIAGQLRFLPPNTASGSADFTVDIDVPGSSRADATTALRVESDLSGIGVQLPAPIGKPAEESRMLTVVVPLGGGPAEGSLRYGDVLRARFSTDAERIAVAFGGADVEPGLRPGVTVNGHLGHLPVDAWRQAIADLPVAEIASDLPPVDVDISIDRVEASPLQVDDVNLRLARTGRTWHGQVDAPSVSGSFVLPDQEGREPVRIDLERLYLALPAGEEEAFHRPDPNAGPDPTKLPGLALTIADLRVEQARLGRLLFEANPSGAGLDLARLQLDGGQLVLEGAGHWQRENGDYRTQIGGSMQIADIGELLVALGYARQLVDAGGQIEYLLQWPGNPAQAYPPAMTGKITMTLDDGRLPELDPGVTRVIGLLNLNALTRRLRLDFSDIYSKGFSFDSIQGDFVFAGGLAETDNLTVQGPSGRIVLDGNADLEQGTLDQHVTVVPNIDATLPIASTLAGGPVAGVAVLVAQEVLAAEVDNINRFEYRLSGPWGAPEIVQLETGGTLSRLIRPLTAARPDAVDVPTSDGPPLPPRSNDPPTEAAVATGGETRPRTSDSGKNANPAQALKEALEGLIDRIRQPDGEPYDPLQTDH